MTYFSYQTLRVLKLMLDVDEPVCGADLIAATGLLSGTIYPMLSRLEEAGWLAGSWEKIDPVFARRPERKFYTLTTMGRKGAVEMLASLAAKRGTRR